jgi:putative spermidine/putrescine transport system substrate-binding protein
MTKLIRPLGRRSFTKLFAAGAAGLVTGPTVFSRTAQAQIRRGDELVVGIWGGAQERITTQYCAKPLEEKYGVKVSFVLGGTDTRRPRVYAERGRPSFDVAYLNIFESRQAVRDGVTQAPTAAVPNFANLYDIAKLGGYGVAFNPVTIVYDKRKVAPITSWKDLWRPELKGRIAWPSYPGAQGTAALLMAAKVWGGSEKDIDIGFRKIAELKPFAAIQSSQDQVFTMFDQGVCDVTVEFGSFSRSYVEARNPNIEIANPVEGQVIAANFACITVGARNQRLAEEWINLHLDIPCQTAYAEQIYYGPTIKNINLPPTLAAKVVTAQDVAKLVDFDWDHVIAMQAQWTGRYNREIAG